MAMEEATPPSQANDQSSPPTSPNGEARISIQGPEEDEGISSPVIPWERPDFFLSVPGARSRVNSLDSLASVAPSSIDTARLHGSNPLQLDGTNPLAHGYTQTLHMLDAPLNARGGYGLSKEETNEALLGLANKAHKDRKILVQRFGRLANYCLLSYQHELIQYDRRVVQEHGKIDEKEMQRLRSLLLDYHMTVWSMTEVNKIKRPSLNDTRSFGKFMACRLHDTHYWYSPDALNLFDVKERPPENSLDPIRRFLQNWLPESLLDQPGKDRRTIERKKRELGLRGGTAQVVRAFENEPFPISPVTDRLARLIIAFIGCIFLLVPIAAITFLPAENIKVLSFIVTVVSVLLFTAIASLGTKATNQELLAAIAAYTAVLVVFLGAAVSPPSK